MEARLLRCLGEVGGSADRILGRKLGDALKFVPHHLAHAASAFYPSGFDAAAILVVDGIGEAACSTLLRGEGARIETIETFSYPHSLGFVWEHASIHLGFSPTARTRPGWRVGLRRRRCAALRPQGRDGMVSGL